jgi:hypothetical protein
MDSPTMDRIPLFVAAIPWVGLTTAACHSPQARPAAEVPASVAGQGDAANTRAARAAARQVEVLRQLVALDRKSVELAELRVADLRVLEQAGRVGNVDRMAAEMEWIEQKRLLLLRELELEQAQEAAAAEAASPPASESPVQRATSP